MRQASGFPSRREHPWARRRRAITTSDRSLIAILAASRSRLMPSSQQAATASTGISVDQDGGNQIASDREGAQGPMAAPSNRRRLTGHLAQVEALDSRPTLPAQDVKDCRSRGLSQRSPA